jgi:hypothetical protein
VKGAHFCVITQTAIKIHRAKRWSIVARALAMAVWAVCTTGSRAYDVRQVRNATGEYRMSDVLRGTTLSRLRASWRSSPLRIVVCRLVIWTPRQRSSRAGTLRSDLRARRDI